MTSYPECFGSLNDWKREALESESLVTRVSKAVTGHALYISIAMDVWRLDRTLKDFICLIHNCIERPKRTQRAEPVTDKEVLEAASALKSLFYNIEGFYSKAKRAGLTNRTLTGAAINSVRQRAEELLDTAEWMELVVSGAANPVFEETLKEYRQGQSYDLDQIGK